MKSTQTWIQQKYATSISRRRRFNRGNFIILQVGPCLLKRLHPEPFMLKQGFSRIIRYSLRRPHFAPTVRPLAILCPLHALCRTLFYAASPGVPVTFCTSSGGLNTWVGENIITSLKLPIVRLCVNNHTRFISSIDVIAALLLQW